MEIRHNMRFWLIIPLLVLIMMCGMTLAHAQSVPDWVKNTAGWWSTDAISETEFVNAIEFLVNEEIIKVQGTQSTSQSQGVPDWVKNTAGWWSTDAISETEFVNAIEFLINSGIIKVEAKNTCESHILKYFNDNDEINKICNEHEDNNSDELIPYDIKLEFNEKGFRGSDFDSVKKSNVYRIFMVGGSTMQNAETTNDVTISSILQKIFNHNQIDKLSDQEIEVINVGISGSNTSMELNLIQTKLLDYNPDLVIMYDGWNDLSADIPIDSITHNYRDVCEIAIVNNFNLVMTLQPIAGFGNKILTEQEKINSLTSEDHNKNQIIQSKDRYDYLEREVRKLADSAQKSNNCKLYDLRNIFDNVSGPIYYDGGHTLHAGNMILAEKFFEISMNEIDQTFPTKKPFLEIISKYNSEPIIKYLLNKIKITEHGFDEKLHDALQMSDGKGKYFTLKHQHGDVSKILVGKDLRNIDLKKMNLDGYDLSGANLSGQDLRGIDFSNVIIRGADLTHSNLEGISFSGLSLIGVDFSNANMKNADFRGAQLGITLQVLLGPDCVDTDPMINIILNAKCMIKVQQEGTILTKFINANLENAKFGDFVDNKHSPTVGVVSFVDFTNSNLLNTEFHNFECHSCKFNNSSIDNLTITGSETKFMDVDFSNANMKNVDFDIRWLQSVSFENASILNSNFQVGLIVDSSFKNTNFDGTDFRYEISGGTNNFNCKNNVVCYE